MEEASPTVCNIGEAAGPTRCNPIDPTRRNSRGMRFAPPSTPIVMSAPVGVRMMSHLRMQQGRRSPRQVDPSQSAAIAQSSESFAIGIARVAEEGWGGVGGGPRNGAAADMFSRPCHVRKKRLPLGDGSKSRGGMLSQAATEQDVNQRRLYFRYIARRRSDNGDVGDSEDTAGFCEERFLGDRPTTSFWG